MREEPSEQIYDTLILFMKNKKKRNKIVNFLKKEGFGTKIFLMQLNGIALHFGNMHYLKIKSKEYKKTKVLLENSIAIPIWLEKV